MVTWSVFNSRLHLSPWIKLKVFKNTLTECEQECMDVVTCKSHHPTLLCMVNHSHSVRKYFCELESSRADIIMCFFHWIVDDVLKPMNKTKFQRNHYVFVAHNGSAYDSQFIYCSAHDFFGSKNVKVLLHMNRMIELRIQVNTGSRLSSIYFKDSYKFINLPLCLLPKLFGFHNDLQKGFFHTY